MSFEGDHRYNYVEKKGSHNLYVLKRKEANRNSNGESRGKGRSGIVRNIF